MKESQSITFDVEEDDLEATFTRSYTIRLVKPNMTEPHNPMIIVNKDINRAAQATSPVISVDLSQDAPWADEEIRNYFNQDPKERQGIPIQLTLDLRVPGLSIPATRLLSMDIQRYQAFLFVSAPQNNAPTKPIKVGNKKSPTGQHKISKTPPRSRTPEPAFKAGSKTSDPSPKKEDPCAKASGNSKDSSTTTTTTTSTATTTTTSPSTGNVKK